MQKLTISQIENIVGGKFFGTEYLEQPNTSEIFPTAWDSNGNEVAYDQSCKYTCKTYIFGIEVKSYEQYGLCSGIDIREVQ